MVGGALPVTALAGNVSRSTATLQKEFFKCQKYSYIVTLLKVGEQMM